MGARLGCGALLFGPVPQGRARRPNGARRMSQLSLFPDPPGAPADWVPTRAAGLQRLNAWVQNAGRSYAGQRNFDFGPGKHTRVSALSPWLRHRLVTEPEVLEAVLARHSLSAAEKYVQEVFWRAYFKGWLEQRPSVWSAYRTDLNAAIDALEADGALAARYDAAVSGKTGIAPFDAWMQELAQTGYLHNHARMWTASIWIFTLRLPWQLGADHFLRHLLDGDPASNTLSWRWVGGLHTRGKTYLARADNIARYTDGRFDPRGQLATRAEPLSETAQHDRVSLPVPDSLPGSGRIGLLVTTEDGRPETLDLPHPPAAILGLSAEAGRSALPVARLVTAFSHAALDDSLQRAADHFSAPASRGDDVDWSASLLDWARSARLDAIVTAHAPTGPAASRLARARRDLDQAGIPLARAMRPYDRAAWPHATAGFFKLKRKIPQILAQIGLHS